MIVLSRNRTSPTSEDIAIIGSTGNIYTVTISHVPTCNCPDSRKGNECKHKVYALHTVLRAPEHLVYQLALLNEELKEIFDGAPAIPNADASAADSEQDKKRKPYADTECPICYMDMLPIEDLVWCKAACGNNMHKSCFDQWAASQRGQTVKCVYCRTPWERDLGSKGMAEIQAQLGSVRPNGYVNVAEQFGMSRERDWSSYHQPWVRRNRSGQHYDPHDPYGLDDQEDDD
jgi:hypothetical protein